MYLVPGDITQEGRRLVVMRTTINILDLDGHTYVSKASLLVELNHNVSTVRSSRAVVCACTVIKQCGTNDVLQVMSRMCVLLLDLNCTFTQHLYCRFVVV